jgi:L-asparaginase
MPSIPPRVGVLLSGGTIISNVDNRLDALDYADGNVKFALDGLRARLPEMDDVATTVTIPFAERLSSTITWQAWSSLLDAVRQADATLDLAGIIITHSSGTLEETAFLLSLLYRGRTPVVLTSSVRPFSALGSDAPMNLIDALRVAASADTDDFGTLVVSNGEILAPGTVVKVDPYAAAAYIASASGSIGRIGVDGTVHLHRGPIVRSALLDDLADRYDRVALGDAELPDVPVLHSYSTSMGRPISALAAAGLPGIVLVGQAGARIAPAEAEVLERLAVGGTPVIVCGRSGGVPLEVSVGYRRAAFSVARTLSAVKARILLALAIGAGLDGAAIRALLEAVDAAND